MQAAAVAEADARDLAKTVLAYGSTGDWLTHVGGLRRGEGKRRVRQARALTSTMTATRQGLVDGVVSPEQAEVIVAAVDGLPSGTRVRASGEARLVDDAGSLDATELAVAGRRLVHVVDPDGEDRRLERELAREERAAHLSRTLSIAQDQTGGVRITGHGSVEDGAILTAALLPLTRPVAPEGSVDPETGEPSDHDARDGGARMWDALIGTRNTPWTPTSHRRPTARGPGSRSPWTTTTWSTTWTVWVWP